MKLLGKCLGLIVGGVVASTAYAAVDGSEAVICAAVEIMEWVPDEACQRVSARDAGIPRFLQIDFAGQQITRPSRAAMRSPTISSAARWWTDA